jgi:hypothetical protein
MASRDLVLVPFQRAESGSVSLEEELDVDELDTWIAWIDDDGRTTPDAGGRVSR